ncbi:MAG: BamA/TamA family outer membrane protein, partial [Gemmataceae bacterium]|nr:BamA/TamA family outer membrane protein [Gemmataceae bacterium]
AVRDEAGWRPMPFVPWHQPWFAEAGVFEAAITLPADEVLVTPAVTKSETPTAAGRKRVVTEPFVGRDFAILCSKRFKEFRQSVEVPGGRTVALRCFAFAEHEFYATEILKIVAEALPVYSDWFGPFPYDQFTVAESFFGWNGNECAGLVMIDERVFGMPHLARGYVDYLVSHETCHQWWYNLVGTNGYSEPFMDEGAAAHFTHRLLDKKYGKNNAFLDWPQGLGWMPNIRRENYRHGGMYQAVRNGQMHPAAQDLPRYGHLFGLFTGAYDRGSKVWGMVEDRLGEAAFLDFTRSLIGKYGWRVLSAADLRRDLEEYTGRDWGEFFDRWVYGKGMTDWAVERVEVRDEVPWAYRQIPITAPVGTKTVRVRLRQTGEYAEPTVLGVRFRGQEGFPVRVPVAAGSGPQRLALPTPAGRDLDVTVEPVGENAVEVRFAGLAEVEQVEVDPDRVLLDADPKNNAWKSPPKLRATFAYTMLDEADLTSDYDRCTITAGPWAWGASYTDPWYTRSTLVGLRAGANCPNEFRTGAYLAYRTGFRDLVFGVDAVIPGKLRETGFNYERRVAGPWDNTDGDGGAQRGVLYRRWTVKQGSSLYLPPMIYHEVFAQYSDNFLPFARTTTPGAVRPDSVWEGGWHGRLNLYTPYWDPEEGVWADFTAAAGETRLPNSTGTGRLRAELAGVKQLPDWLGEARLAGRVVAAGALPDQGQFFALGGGTLFRGYDLAQRQGSALWVANAELRLPLARHVTWDCLDHCVGARNVWLATFVDAGDIYANGRSVGGRVAYAVGAGLRVDAAVFSFIERATLRLDLAKTVNDNTPFQLWFGLQHAF